MPRLALVLLILILTSAVGCRVADVATVGDFPAPESLLPWNLAVVTWNAQKGLDPRWVDDLGRLFDVEEPDLVFIQEARENIPWPSKSSGYFARSWQYPWPGGAVVGVLTLSRIPALRTDRVPTRGREFLVTAPKVSLISEYPLPDGQTLLAANIHCLNFERFGTGQLRDQLDQMREKLSAHTGPILMVGDFNTWNEKRLGVVRVMASELGLREVEAFEGDRTRADQGMWNGMLGVDPTLPLDRVFFRGFRVRSARVLPFDSSDHRPLKVELELSDR